MEVDRLTRVWRRRDYRQSAIGVIIFSSMEQHPWTSRGLRKLAYELRFTVCEVVIRGFATQPTARKWTRTNTFTTVIS